MKRARLIAPALAAALLLTGCTEQGAQVQDSLDHTVQQWSRPTTEPIVFSGPTADGGTFESKRYLGRVVVVNFWYAQCAPCIAEAPTLKKLSAEFASDGVQFVGVNTRDGAADARSFEKEHGITYPSVLDQRQMAAAQLAFSSSIGPRDTPSTIVLDRKGRVVARYLGLANESNLHQLVEDAVDGRST